MFGIIRPCRHRLGGELAKAWSAQLCGLCLALRDDHGQAARIATNYDGLVISLLVEGQSPTAPQRRGAGPCPLRGMRRADVAVGESVRLAAVVSLVLAAARVRDHVDDHDGVVGTVGVRPAARRVAKRWARQGADAGRELGFDTAILVDAIDRQTALEAAAVPGSSLLTITEPTETAVAAAFGHTALLAGRPGNQPALQEIGRLFGRVAHLLDAVEDYAEDAARGKWNPLAATGTSIADARTLCDGAVLGIELALADVDFADGRLVKGLLTRELRRAVHRSFKGSGSCTTRVTTHDPYYGGPPNYGDQSMGVGPYNPGYPLDIEQQQQPQKSGWCRDTCGECCDCDCCCDCDGCCCCDDCCCSCD